jgi:integrase
MARRKVINRDEPPRGRFLSNAEVKRLLDNARSPRDKAIILSALENGVSLSGIRSLKYEDVTKTYQKKSTS